MELGARLTESIIVISLSTNKGTRMTDRRDELIEAGLEILREEGLAGFSQARIAARVGLRQGHLTYYFPTRTTLLAAVARKAIDNQLASLGRMVASTASKKAAAKAITAATLNHRNTRVLVALNQAADQEAEVRAVFNELTDGFVTELGKLLKTLGLEAGEDRIDMVHALFVGLSVIELATSRARGRERSEAALQSALSMLAGARPSRSKPARRES
jgi:AcrR family transcriptional regulator